MRNVSAKFVEKIKIHILKGFPKVVPFLRWCGEIWWKTTGHVWQY